MQLERQVHLHLELVTIQVAPFGGVADVLHAGDEELEDKGNDHVQHDEHHQHVPQDEERPGKLVAPLRVGVVPAVDEAVDEAVHDDLVVVVPVVNDKRKEQLLAIKAQIAPDLELVIVDGQSTDVMSACDVVMLASGTATLEAALLK